LSGRSTDEGDYAPDFQFSFGRKWSPRTFIARDKSMPSFQAERDRLTLLVRANAADNFKFKPMFSDHSPNPRVLKNYPKFPLPAL
jgi:hypothetical protein